MVATSHGNTRGRDWRDQSRQCESRDRSWGGFHRLVVRGLAIPRWNCSVCAAAFLALSGLQLTANPAFANVAPIVSVQTEADFETALNAYQDENFARALRLGKTAAEAGSLEAAVMVGYILRHGQAGAPDLEGARHFYEMAAARSHPDALVALGQMGLAGEAGLTDADAYSYLLRASESGRNDATLALAEMTRAGRGIDADKEAERDLLKRGHAAFDFAATKKLADSYLTTEPKRALSLYEKAAAKGDPDAAYAAGIMYAQNFDIRPNEEKSAYWLGRAASLGHAAAQADYGLLVYQGAGVERNEKAAADWFRQSALNGDTEGMFLYAFTLAKGEGVEQSFEDSYYWLLKSGESTVDDYQEDRAVLRERLEQNVDAELLAAAKARLDAEGIPDNH